MTIAEMFTERELEMLEFLTRAASNEYINDCYGRLKMEALGSIREKFGFEPTEASKELKRRETEMER